MGPTTTKSSHYKWFLPLLFSKYPFPNWHFLSTRSDKKNIINNSSCRVFHLTLDFITRICLVSHVNLHSVLSFWVISEKKKKKPTPAPFPGCPLFTLPHLDKYQFGVGAKSDEEGNLQLLEMDHRLDYLILTPASSPMLYIWSFSSHKNLQLFGDWICWQCNQDYVSGTDNQKVCPYKLAEAIISFDVSLYPIPFFSTNAEFLKTHPTKPILLSQVRKGWKARMF